MSWWTGEGRNMQALDGSNAASAGPKEEDDSLPPAEETEEEDEPLDAESLKESLKDSLSAIERQYAALPPDLPRRIHIIGTGNIGKLVAHTLRGLPNPPPVTLIFHRYKLLQAWESSPKQLTIQDDGFDIKRSGFEAEVLQEIRREHGVPIEREQHTPHDSNTNVRPHEAAEVQRGYLSTYKPVDQLQSEDARPSSDEPIHNLIVTTKAFHTVAALLSLKHRLSPTSTICLLQNGLGIIDELNEKLFPDAAERPNYMQGIITHGVNVPPEMAERDPFYAVHAGRGTVALGLLPRDNEDRSPIALARRSPGALDNTGRWAPSSRYLLRTLTRSPILCAVGHTPTELLQLQLEKLAVNSIINPLTVLLDTRNGHILYNFALTRTMRLMLAETSLVIRSLPELRGLANVQNRFSAARLETLVVSVANTTQDNISSMLADVRASRKTEIEYINGYIVRRGEELGIKCLVNYAIMHTVIGKSNIMQRQSRDEVPMEGRIDLQGGL